MKPAPASYRYMRSTRPVLLAFALVLATSCAGPPVNRQALGPLPTAAHVDVDRYLGRWYEIARLPNGFEKNCEGVTADYQRRDDGLIGVLNACRKGGPTGPLKQAEGRARIVDAETNAKLKVSFFGPFWGDYWILHIADDYSLSLVGEPSGRYLWILARTPTLSEAKKADALLRLKSVGYDVSKLHFADQPPQPDNPQAPNGR
ncbi:MAG TPA: lipocalin family protein [Parvularculaceae bacterium]|nr:lipocalin family protein [Parvularculaceae bacterium]